MGEGELGNHYGDSISNKYINRCLCLLPIPRQSQITETRFHAGNSQIKSISTRSGTFDFINVKDFHLLSVYASEICASSISLRLKALTIR